MPKRNPYESPLTPSIISRTSGANVLSAVGLGLGFITPVSLLIAVPFVVLEVAPAPWSITSGAGALLYGTMWCGPPGLFVSLASYFYSRHRIDVLGIVLNLLVSGALLLTTR